VQRRQPRRRPKGRMAPSIPRRETSELNVSGNVSFHLSLTVDDKEKPS